MLQVVRTLQVLDAVAGSSTGMTLQELGTALSIPLPSLYRLMAVLMEQGFATRSPNTKRYRSGPNLRALAGHAAPGVQSALVQPHPAMRLASEVTGETVFLTELHENRAVCVSLVEGRHPLRLFVHVGKEMPLHAAASARTLLVDLSDADILELLGSQPLPSYTPGTPESPEHVLKHVKTIRKRGYDICRDELDDDVWAVSVPVRNADGLVLASITLAAPQQRMSTASRRQDARDAVLEAARVLSGSLGHNP